MSINLFSNASIDIEILGCPSTLLTIVGSVTKAPCFLFGVRDEGGTLSKSWPRDFSESFRSEMLTDLRISEGRLFYGYIYGKQNLNVVFTVTHYKHNSEVENKCWFSS